MADTPKGGASSLRLVSSDNQSRVVINEAIHYVNPK